MSQEGPDDRATADTAVRDEVRTDAVDTELSALGDDTASVDIDDIFVQLERLEATVTSEEEQREVERTRQMLERVPGSDHIRKYTTRDIGEAVVGGIVFALPLLVEDGVFEIAEWFLEITLGPVPVFLLMNVLFVVVLTTGLLYAIDFRTVRITNPLFGLVPRRLVGVLAVSLLVAAGTMLMWGRLHAEDPTAVEQASRITVIWAAAALGAVLADILPGESQGADISTLVGED